MINPDEPDTQRILSDLKQRTRVIEGFVQQTAQLMAELRSESVWVKVGAAREMANFGALYESVQKSNPIVFEAREMPPRLRELAERAGKEFGFMPNGCLLNYYSDGLNTIGFHSDAPGPKFPRFALSSFERFRGIELGVHETPARRTGQAFAGGDFETNDPPPQCEDTDQYRHSDCGVQLPFKCFL